MVLDNHAFVSARALQARHAGVSLGSIEALTGRLTEVSGLGAQAVLSVAMQWVLAAQQGQELAAWIQLGPSVPFIPDVAKTGVDLTALPFIVMPTMAYAIHHTVLRCSSAARSKPTIRKTRSGTS